MKRALLILLGAIAALLVLLIGFVGVRYLWAMVEVGRADSAVSLQKMSDLGTTRTLKVLPLYENASVASDLQTGAGVSYLIQTDETTILFDVGDNPTSAAPSPLEQNMQQLGVSLNSVDTIVISHNHPDHTGGTQWWMKGTFSPGSEQTDLGHRAIYVPEPMTYPGAAPVVVTQPLRVATGVATMGPLPFVQPFPVLLWSGQGAEQSLAVNVEGAGIVVITGCGHPGLERIVRRAQGLFSQPIVGVIGGLHYTTADASSLSPQIQFLQTLHPRLVALSPHDSGPAARDAFRQAFADAYRDIQVGEPLQIENP